MCIRLFNILARSYSFFLNLSRVKEIVAIFLAGSTIKMASDIIERKDVDFTVMFSFVE